MKPFLILPFICLLMGMFYADAWGQTQVSAQQESPAFLLSSPMKLSGFGGPLYEYSVVQGDFTVASGGGGALLINQQFWVGLYNVSSTRRDDITWENRMYTQARIDFNHGGLWLGYIHRSHALIHYGISARIGGGNIRLNQRERADPISNRETQLAHDGIFAFTPQAEAELNILRWMKLNIGVGYRAVAGIKVLPYHNRDFSSPQGTVTLMFGWFDQ